MFLAPRSIVCFVDCWFPGHDPAPYLDSGVETGFPSPQTRNACLHGDHARIIGWSAMRFIPNSSRPGPQIAAKYCQGQGAAITAALARPAAPMPRFSAQRG